MWQHVTAFFWPVFDIPSPVNNNFKGNVHFVLSGKHSKNPGTLTISTNKTLSRLPWHQRVTAPKEESTKNSVTLSSGDRVCWFIYNLYFCWIILPKVWASGVLSLVTDIPEMCSPYSEDKLYFCWVFAVRKFWLSQKSCCAWITSVPMEARDQGQEQQRREGNRRRLITAENITKMLTSGSRERRREECWDGSREPHPRIPFSLAKQVAALYF